MSFRKLTLEEIKEMAINARGQIHGIVLHWSAGHYGSLFQDYHINIDEDGTMYAPNQIVIDEYEPHCWHRNTGNVGITLACAYGAHSIDDLGDEPPTDAQIEAMAQAIAVICKYAKIEITKDNVMTHAEAAELDDYGPSTTCERWDLWVIKAGDEPGSGGDELRGKAIFYQNTNQLP